MLLSGKEKLERMRDGRIVYVGSERVDDVTSHPAFRNAAQTVAALYDFKSDPANRDELAFEEDGEYFSIYWKQCRTREDLAKRMRALRAIADQTFGMFGRSPDHVAGMVTGLSMKPDVLDALTPGFGDNLTRFYRHARSNDYYLCFATSPPSGVRSSELFPGQLRDDPSLQVVREDGDGVVLSGMKMLATGAVFADEVWIGNLTPIDEKHRAQSITCALPFNAQGISLWSRRPYEQTTPHELDYPLSYRLDEGDCMLVCDNVKVPWERVFLHNDGVWSRRIYIETPANCYANSQSNIRFWAKMSLVAGLASKICDANGISKIPGVRELLGRIAALEATIGGMVHGQIEGWEAWPEGFATPNRRFMYASLNWCQEHHSEIIDILRTLLGGLPMQMPASIDVLKDPELAQRFDRWWGTADMDALPRMKLYKLAWDLVGSEFAGRHQLYEKFYAGNSIVVRNQSDREAPWDVFHGTVDRLLDRVNIPDFK
jgi:4-hydroxyphenylacetate 3-monooxygenase